MSRPKQSEEDPWSGQSWPTNTGKRLRTDGRAFLSVHKGHAGALPTKPSPLLLLVALHCWSCNDPGSGNLWVPCVPPEIGSGVTSEINTTG